MGIIKAALGLAGAGAAIEYGIARYFFKRTLVRGSMPVEKTMEMAGTDWGVYRSRLEEIGAWLEARPREEVYTRSGDGLRLHATWFPAQGARKTAIILHGYTSKGMDNAAQAVYFLKRGYNVLLPDARAHGTSEGIYIGFGVLDRWDLLRWIGYVEGMFAGGESGGHEVILHGTSMGGATVLMAAGQTLPASVKGIISDCAFTSAWDVFTHVLNSWYHLPAFPILHTANRMAKRSAGYDLREVNSAREVRRATAPLLLIHGAEDTFVPSAMCREIHAAAPRGTGMLIVPGAAHGEAYYKDTAAYEAKVGDFLRKTMNRNEGS